MGKTLHERLINTLEGRRLYQREEAILEMTECVCGVMKAEGVSREELVRRLESLDPAASPISLYRRTQWLEFLLDGRLAPTVQAFADLFTAMGRRMKVTAEQIETKGEQDGR